MAKFDTTRHKIVDIRIYPNSAYFTRCLMLLGICSYDALAGTSKRTCGIRVMSHNNKGIEVGSSWYTLYYSSSKNVCIFCLQEEG